MVNVDQEIGLAGSEVEDKKPLSVLIAEDEKHLIPLLEITFKMAGGFDTTAVEKKVDALRILRDSKKNQKPIDVVFSDWGLADDPEGGREIAIAVRDEGLARYLIIFSARAGELGKDSKKLKAMGIDMLLGKPMTPNELMPRLNEAKNTILESQVPQK
jgi:DNA-binding response OmpR family regulator